MAMIKELFFSKNRKKKLSRFAKWIQTSAILGAVFTAVSLLMDIKETVFDYLSHDLCPAIQLTKMILGSVALYFSYLVFWLRQRSLYNKKKNKSI